MICKRGCKGIEFFGRRGFFEVVKTKKKDNRIKQKKTHDTPNYQKKKFGRWHLKHWDDRNCLLNRG